MNNPPRPTFRIAWALVIAIGLAVLVAGFSSSRFVYALARSTLINQSIQEMSQTAQNSAKKLTEESRQHPGRSPVEDLNDLSSGHLYLLLVSRGGHFIGSSGTLPPTMPAAGWSHAAPSGWFIYHHVPYVFAIASIHLSGHTDRLIVADGLVRTASLLSTLQSALTFGEILLIISSILAVIIIVGNVTKPLRALETAAETITLNEQPIAIQSSITEVISLTNSLNRMLERLSTAQERERQFISNAAHALRTPIHIIRGYTRSLNFRGDTNKELHAQAIKVLMHESQAMETLVERLLQLSRMDQGQPPVLANVPLRPFLHSIFPYLRDTCLHHPLSLSLAPNFSLNINSEPDLLHMVLRILVENADAYADPDTPVILFATPLSPTTVRIGVTNQGPNIPDDTRAQLFERFYRANQPASSQHFGLGLSIADAIVRQLGGQWSITSQQHTTQFAIDCPIQSM